MTTTAPHGRTALSIEEWLASLRTDGERLGEVAGSVAIDAPVPGCPGWDVEALLRHMGDVHRWAATIVRERLRERLRQDFIGPSDRDGLLAWYRDGHAQLLETLSAASPGDEFWMWGEAPNARAFWARRQAHETSIHRLDVEQAAGVGSTAFPVRIAVDGIDEWLMLATQRVKVPGDRGRSLLVVPIDAPDRWLVELRDDGLSVERTAAAADRSVGGTASDLFALLMNRRDTAGLHIDGDADVLRAWRQHVRFI